ncbi:hypothetical protein F25303_11482 [Fusarium sp. NRRL 25303]|nr:hypothetical protein F25303_11482 [Fusarium sp. NRRL 25303]
MDPVRPRSRDEFKVALICALPLEANSVLSLFDHHWDEDDGSPRIGKARGDPNSYSIGIMSGHHVVLAHPPGIGTIAAGTIAAFCKLSFTSIRLALVVGICGGAPMNNGIQIHLGDVIISTGIVSYDFGRRFPDGFEMKDTLSEQLRDRLEGSEVQYITFSASYIKAQTLPCNTQELGKTFSSHNIIDTNITSHRNVLFALHVDPNQTRDISSQPANHDGGDIQGAPNELPALPWHPQVIQRNNSDTQVPSEPPSGSIGSQTDLRGANEYFIPHDGIALEMITADISHYLGNDATARPGHFENPATGQAIQGYYVKGFRTLTMSMVEDLKADSAAWNNTRHSESPQTEVNEDSCSYYTETGTPGYNGTDGDFDSAPFSSQGPWEHHIPQQSQWSVYQQARDVVYVSDEASRPSCAQCRRGGRPCPGYVREMKFVDEGPKLRRSRRKAHASITTSISEKVSKYDARHNGDLLRHQRETSRLSQPGSFKAERDQILSSFVSAMFPLNSSTAQISFLGSWLWHLPPRLGSSAVLDHAALSVAWAYFAKLYGDPIALRNAEISYSCAVRNLALALDDAKEQLSSNVLCATVLLGHFELRGAQRCYESAFEYSMFLACRGAIISEALASGQPCILESESWQSIPDGLIEFPLLPASPDMYRRIFGYFALIPGLQCRTSLCNKAASDETQSALLSTAKQLRQNMRQWYQEYSSQDNNLRKPRAISPVSEGYPFPSIYKYHDVMSATIIVAYYAYLIVLNQSIADLDTFAKHSSEIQDLATAIYDETCTTYCSLGIAYPVSSMDTQMDGQV